MIDGDSKTHMNDSNLVMNENKVVAKAKIEVEIGMQAPIDAKTEVDVVNSNSR